MSAATFRIRAERHYMCFSTLTCGAFRVQEYQNIIQL